MLDELRATEYAPPRRRRPRLPRLHRRRAVRRVAAARARRGCCESTVFGNPHSINPTSAASTELVERARAYVLEFFNAVAGRVRRDLHAERDRRAAAGRRGVPVPSRRPLPADLRQPQLGQRHPRVRARPRRRDDLRAERRARPARRREPVAALPDRDRRAITTTCSPIPAQSNFSGVQHPLEWIEQAHAHGWDVLLDAAALRADQPARPRPLAPGLRRALVLQDVRLADRRRLPARPPRRARQARAPVVLRRHDRRRVRAARVLPLRARRRALRGRHRQLPQPARRRDRPALPRPDRHRHDPHARRRARRLAARRARVAARTATARPRRRSTARDRGSGAAPRSRSTSCTRTAASSTSATSTASPAGTTSRCAPAASATPAPARSPSRSRARRSSAASSATA